MHFGAVILGPKRHLGDILQPDQGAALLQDDQILEFLHRTQVGVGR